MTFLQFLNSLPLSLERFGTEITTRTMQDKYLLLKKLLRGAFDAGRYNDPDRKRDPVPFMPSSSYKDQLEVTEMEKWSGMWRTREFRAVESPVDPLVDTAVAALGCVPSNSIIDFGCGRGLALDKLGDQGLLALGVDIASNALDERFAAHFPFLRACLWNLPDCLTADYGYCTDVMEHIPEKKIDDTLLDMTIAVRQSTFFQIQYTYQRCAGWWYDALKERYDTVFKYDEGEKYVQFVTE